MVSSARQSVKFTVDRKANGRLSFLDCNVKHVNGKLLTSVHHKCMFLGLGCIFLICFFHFKLNSISSLLSWGYKISSTNLDMHDEFDFLRLFLTNNGFPLSLINSRIKKFLFKIFVMQSDVSPDNK